MQRIHQSTVKQLCICACRNTFKTRSTIGDIKVDILCWIPSVLYRYPEDYRYRRACRTVQESTPKRKSRPNQDITETLLPFWGKGSLVLWGCCGPEPRMTEYGRQVDQKVGGPLVSRS